MVIEQYMVAIKTEKGKYLNLRTKKSSWSYFNTPDDAKQYLDAEIKAAEKRLLKLKAAKICRVTYNREPDANLKKVAGRGYVGPGKFINTILDIKELSYR